MKSANALLAHLVHHINGIRMLYPTNNESIVTFFSQAKRAVCSVAMLCSNCFLSSSGLSTSVDAVIKVRNCTRKEISIQPPAFIIRCDAQINEERHNCQLGKELPRQTQLHLNLSHSTASRRIKMTENKS